METQDTTHRCILALRALNKDTFLDGGISYYQDNFFVESGSFNANKR